VDLPHDLRTIHARALGLLPVVDEPGYLPREPDAAHLFFQLVSRRYERGSMLVTSNRAVGEWGTAFGDTVVATAILDRLEAPHRNYGIFLMRTLLICASPVHSGTAGELNVVTSLQYLAPPWPSL